MVTNTGYHVLSERRVDHVNLPTFIPAPGRFLTQKRHLALLQVDSRREGLFCEKDRAHVDFSTNLVAFGVWLDGVCL